MGYAVPEVHVAGGAHVVENAQRTEEADVLKRARDAAGGNAIGTVTDDGFSGESDLAGGRPINAGDQIEDRRFPRAIGSDEADEFALADGERKIRNAPQPSKLHGHRVQLQQGRGHVFFRFRLTAPNNPCGRVSMRMMRSSE